VFSKRQNRSGIDFLNIQINLFLSSLLAGLRILRRDIISSFDYNTEKLIQYQEEDIYNMDETGLYWRQSLSKGLTIENRAGQKKDRTRISVVCCTNATGSDRLPLWFIGKSKTPRALKRVCVPTVAIEQKGLDDSIRNEGVVGRFLPTYLG
jgi:hypothetical protein